MSSSPLPTREIGRTGLRVSELGLGTAALGNLFEPVSDRNTPGAVERTQVPRAHRRDGTDPVLTDYSIIDSHQHFWDPARGDYGWLRPGEILYRTYQPDDLAPLLQAAGIQGSILVQAAPTVAETDYLLHLARLNPWILGVVGWIDLAAHDIPQRIEERVREPLFVGVRPMLQDLSDRSWILKPELSAGIEAVRDRSLVFDALVRADQLPTIVTLADRHSTLAIVLDHAGKPPFGNVSALARWHADMISLAKRANVACKLSGLLTELPDGTPADGVDWCVDLLIDLFGPDRLLWGSDWPVATTVIDYAEWLRRCCERVAARLPGQHDAIFGGNARRIYRLVRSQNIQSSEA